MLMVVVLSCLLVPGARCGAAARGIVFVTGNKGPCVTVCADGSEVRDLVQPPHNVSILRSEWVSVVRGDLHSAHALTTADTHTGVTHENKSTTQGMTLSESIFHGLSCYDEHNRPSSGSEKALKVDKNQLWEN